MSPRFFIAAVAVLSAATPGSAQITITFSPDGRGGVLVVGTGAGTTINDSNGPVEDFDYGNATTDFLSDTLVGEDQVNTDRLVSGSLQNLTEGLSQPIDRIGVDRDPTSADDIDIRLEDPIAFSNGDEFAFDLVAGFAESTLSFDSLIPGTHTILAGDDEVVVNEEIFGTVTIVVVDEVLVGDFNDDAIVDAADFTLLRDTFNSAGSNLPADATGDDSVDLADFNAFAANFGGVAPGFPAGGFVALSAVAAPEPSALTTALLGLVGWLIRRRRSV